MGIEVKQLTINSTLQREDGTKNDEANEAQAKNISEKKPIAGSDGSLLDPDVLKAEILAECKRMIGKAAEEQRSR